MWSTLEEFIKVLTEKRSKWELTYLWAAALPQQMWNRRKRTLTTVSVCISVTMRNACLPRGLTLLIVSPDGFSQGLLRIKKIKKTWHKDFVLPKSPPGGGKTLLLSLTVYLDCTAHNIPSVFCRDTEVGLNWTDAAWWRKGWSRFVREGWDHVKGCLSLYWNPIWDHKGACWQEVID